MAFPKIDGYVVTEKLGSGSYSTVYKAYTKVGARSAVAIKCVDKSRVKHSGSAVDNLITEIRLLKTLRHPYIVHMHNFTWDDKNIYIIMEYCCGGDLSKYIHRYGRVPEKQVLYFLQQLASALKFLREKGVVHMDLKPHNLLLHKGSNGKYILKVADFGFAQHMSLEGMRSVRGSPLYMAPEMLAGEYDARVDLWSVGVIMYECLFGKAPYSSNTFKELVEKIENKAPIEIPRNSSISAPCSDLLTRLLQHDPNNRITYEDFFAHEYLDLEHMPSKENYEKAVSLIKQAIDLDASGKLEMAFEAYKASLLYLVPCVSCETDAVRRSALTAKLTRYMERAEEIKLYLKQGTGSLPTPSRVGASPARRTDMICCINANNTTSCEFPEGLQCSPCPRNGSIQNSSIQDVKNRMEMNALRETGSSCDTSQSSTQSNARTGSRFGILKLFGRQTSVPYLDTKDSSVTNEANAEKSQKTADEAGNDPCRIT